MPGFFIFNNGGGQSMTTTPLPFKIQNNVMLTSFFQPQNSNQNLTLNLNANVDSKNIKTPKHNNLPGFSGFNNSNIIMNNANSNRNSEKDETIHDSSNSLDRISKNSFNSGNNNNMTIDNNQNSNQNILNNVSNSHITFHKSIVNPQINQKTLNKNLGSSSVQNIGNSHSLQLNLANTSTNKKNLSMKKNSQNLILMPSPLPGNNFYGWIFNNTGAVGAQANHSHELNMNENAENKINSKNQNNKNINNEYEENNGNKEQDYLNNSIKSDKNCVENKVNKHFKKGINGSGNKKTK